MLSLSLDVTNPLWIDSLSVYNDLSAHLEQFFTQRLFFSAFNSIVPSSLDYHLPEMSFPFLKNILKLHLFVW